MIFRIQKTVDAATDGETHLVRLFKSKSGRKYKYTAMWDNEQHGAYENEFAYFCQRDEPTVVIVTFLDCDDINDLDFGIESEQNLPVYSQSRNLDLDYEANPTKVRFDRPVRKLELD